MCGIIGCANDSDIVPTILAGLERLEYRGYDSTGIAVGDSGIRVVKREGELDELVETVEDAFELDGTVGVGHTRWSTHGKPSDDNAHPHTDCENRVAVVHNGIIENYEPLRDELDSAGHEFESDTDTEVVPHLIGRHLDAGLTPKVAFCRAVEKLNGSYAIAAIFESHDEVMAARRDSSLVLGVGEDATYVASDMTALVGHADTVIHLDDGEFAFLSENGYTVTDGNGTPQSKTRSTIEWDVEDVAKAPHDHYMIKEIHEQSSVLRDCLRDRFTADQFVSLDGLDDYRELDCVHLVACGTSYHAALYGAKLLCKEGITAQAYLASEYALSPPPIGNETVVVGVTQSGETADTLAALRAADERGARTVALTNVVGSTADRECDDSLYIRSGPEISVAATKTFASQLVTLNLFALHLSNASNHEPRRLVPAFRELPGQVQRVLDTTDAEAIARRFVDSPGFFFIGRELQYPVALEGALKMKEITYEHAEGFAAGELKHGPLALVTEETPVFVSAISDDETVRKTVANAKEVKTRGAPLVAVTDGASSIDRLADEVLRVPATHRKLAPILVNVQYQLLAYHTARLLGRDIDKPRNLAKSVTVE